MLPLHAQIALTNDIFSAHDIHVSIDGNFHHRRKASAGPEAPGYYTPTLFLSKEEVDKVGDRIQAARSKGKRPRNNSTRRRKTAAAADAGCSNSFSAAQERRKMSGEGRFSDKGLMAMVCRHDIPLFLANIDTPGEQQKYSIALITHLFSLLPSNAKVTVIYDIGCVLDQSLGKVCNIFLRSNCSNNFLV